MEFLKYRFDDHELLAQTYDELPLWSAPFGLILLDLIELRHNMTIMDLGSGTGFPLLEIASRAGNTCKLIGVDPWKNANQIVMTKIKNYDLHNVQLYECSAESIPMNDCTVDLMVSNLGINNFENPLAVIQEAYRLLKNSGKICITSNLTGHWKLFYDIFSDTLLELNLRETEIQLRKEEAHRGSPDSIAQYFTDAGFLVLDTIQKDFVMKFTNGTAFLNHHFVKLGWLNSWIKLVPQDKLELVFSRLEQNLNHHAVQNKGLHLNVPILALQAIKN